MKKKIISEKRNVKKKVAKKLPAFNNPEQWGSAFENLRHQAHEFNMLSKLGSSKAGDPFATAGKKNVFTIPLIRKLTGKGVRGGDLMGSEEGLSTFDVHISGPDDVDKNDILDAMRYYTQSIHPLPSGLFMSVDPALRKDDVPPAHYAHGKLEPWDVVKDWSLDYFTGCAVKYICRHKHKGTPEQDIQKAIDYLVEYKKTLSKETK